LTAFRALLLSVALVGCARVAGLDELEIRVHDDGGADTHFGETSVCDAVVAVGFACQTGAASIPGGCFIPRSGPAVAAAVDPFCADETEVTVAAYSECVDAGACPPAESTVTRTAEIDDATYAVFNALCNAGKAGHDLHPLNCVDALAADTYCKWRGGRVPTDLEYEWIAHGAAADSIYPWGNESVVDQPCWKRTGTCVAGSSADVGPLRVHDLVGNVGEWTSSSVEGDRIARGGAWSSTLPPQLTARGQLAATARLNVIGFRCVR
jgi:formylglycine-generating enzyme required for sulfatase activity